MRRRSGNRWSIALGALFAFASAGCPGVPDSAVPQLPGDGAIPTARKPAAHPGGKDAWTGRDLLPAPAPSAPQPLAMPPVHHFTLPNGLAVVALQAADVPVVSFKLGIRAGRRHEVRERTGLASLTAAALVRGSARRNRAQLDAAAEAAGASLTASASYEVTLLGCTVPRVDQATCSGILGELVATPGIDQRRLDDARTEVARSLRQSAADPAQLATLHLQNAMWGERHPRGWVASDASLARIGKTDVLDWVKTRIRPDNAILLVVGDFERGALETDLKRAFGGWKRGARPAASPAPEDPALRGLAIRVVDQPGAVRGHVRIGALGVGHRDADFAALAVVNHILGGSATARLARAVKDKLGPASAASSSFDRNLERGALVVSGTAPTAQLVSLTRLMIDQIARLGDRGPTAAELGQASSEIASGYAVRFDSPNDLGDALLAAALHDMDDASVRDFAPSIGKVDLAAARTTAGRRLDGKNLVVVLVGDGAMLGRALDDAGLTFERVPASGAIAAYDRVAAAPAAPASPAEEKAARAVLDAALAKKGGAARLGAITSVRWKGSAVLTMQGNKIPGQVARWFAAPEKMRFDMTLEGGKVQISTVLDGTRGWARQSQAGADPRVIDFPDAEVTAGHGQLWRDADLVLLRHRADGAQVAPEADVEVDGAPCHAIRVTDKSGARSVILLIDKKSKRLAGQRYSENGQSAEERYGDYKKVAGLEVAHRRSTRSADVDIVTTIGEIAFDSAIDAAVFARPAK